MSPAVQVFAANAGVAVVWGVRVLGLLVGVWLIALISSWVGRVIR
jgi:hypothetical protein